MKKLFMLTVAVFLAILVAGTANALTWDDHVSQAPNGKGEVLIFPIYSTLDGWETKLQVINTSLNTAAVARISLHSWVFSEELIDFLVFLTPTDMWEGVIRQQETEPGSGILSTFIHSTDPSTLRAIGLRNMPAFASEAEPFNNMLPVPHDGNCGDSQHIGYAKVYLSWVFQGGNVRPGMQKGDLYQWYLPALRGEGEVPLFGQSPSAARAAGVNANILAGNLTMEHAVNSLTASLPATVLKNYGNRLPLDLIRPVILGLNADNTMGEVEAALSKDNISMPYIADDSTITAHAFNFPTKYTQLTAACGYNGALGRFTGFNDFFVPFQWRVMDLEENWLTPLPTISPPSPDGFIGELNFAFPQVFPAGWALYRFPGTGLDLTASQDGEISYVGAPVIPFVKQVTPNGLNMMYGAWTDGVVEHTIPGVIPGYQYE